MKTTIENLLKIEGSKQYQNTGWVIVVYQNEQIQIFYKIPDRLFKPSAFISDYDEHSVDIHFFETIEDVINQVYYITGEKIKLKND